jgi:D-arabinose 1-dehydrogenase-like Zn-dependent alcohol dehydrogenase
MGDRSAVTGLPRLKVAGTFETIRAEAFQRWPSGAATDSEDTLNFAVQTSVRPMIEKYPLERANDAYERMMSGKAEYRVVLTM